MFGRMKMKIAYIAIKLWENKCAYPINLHEGCHGHLVLLHLPQPNQRMVVHQGQGATALHTAGAFLPSRQAHQSCGGAEEIKAGEWSQGPDSVAVHTLVAT